MLIGMDDLNYLSNLFGNPHEELDEEIINELIEEIFLLENDDLFKITCGTISLGKWQILLCILDKKNFTCEQCEVFKKVLENYVNDHDDDHDDSDSHDHDDSDNHDHNDKKRHINGEKIEKCITEYLKKQNSNYAKLFKNKRVPNSSNSKKQNGS